MQSQLFGLRPQHCLWAPDIGSGPFAAGCQEQSIKMGWISSLTYIIFDTEPLQRMSAMRVAVAASWQSNQCPVWAAGQIWRMARAVG